MKEYRLKINGEIDFIIISPQVLSSLISQIHNSLECEVAVNIEDIMPPGFTDYLLRVINTNRFTNKQFRYHYILENLVTKKGLYEILRQQLSNTDIEKSPLFSNHTPDRYFPWGCGVGYGVQQTVFLGLQRYSSKVCLHVPRWTGGNTGD